MHGGICHVFDTSYPVFEMFASIHKFVHAYCGGTFVPLLGLLYLYSFLPSIAFLILLLGAVVYQFGVVLIFVKHFLKLFYVLLALRIIVGKFPDVAKQ